MDPTSKIDWESDGTLVPLNPRQSEIENEKLRSLTARFPLKGHVWIASSGSQTSMDQSVKLVALSKKAFLVSASAVNRHLESDSKDIWLQALPEFHVGGLSIHARAHLSRASVVSLESWSASSFVDAIRDRGATLSSLVPTQVFDLVRGGFRPPKSLRAIVVGGSSLSNDLYLQATGFGWPLLPSYGMTECCSQIATASLQRLSSRDTSLQLLTHVEAECTKGQLKVRSEALLTGFAQWKNGKAEFRDPKVDGWYQSEDLCEIDGRTLLPQGRGSEFVKVSGEGVSLLKLQHLLEKIAQEHFPELWKDFAILALEDPRSQHQIVLASVLEPGDPKLRILIENFNAQVAPFEKIKLALKVQSVPRTALGKIAREKLKSLF